MPLVLSIDSEIPELEDRLDAMAREQIPFATALALTWTAQDCQKELRRELPRRFTIRNNYLERGIRVRAATKRRLAAEVFTLDEILRLQIEGGTKHPGKRGIPLPRAVKPSGKGIYRKAKRPPALRQKAKHFERPIRQGGEGLFRRRGKKRYPIEFLWRLYDRSIQIDSAFDFDEIVARTTRKRWSKNFGRALAKALASRKT